MRTGKVAPYWTGAPRGSSPSPEAALSTAGRAVLAADSGSRRVGDSNEKPEESCRAQSRGRY